jgi:hypothetical protein
MRQCPFSRPLPPSPPLLFLPVIPAKAGIHAAVGKPEKLDSRFRGNDGVEEGHSAVFRLNATPVKGAGPDL